MKKKITLLPGDGIGPEVMNHAVKIIQSVNEIYGHEFELTEHAIGAASIDATGEALTDDTVANCKYSDAVLLGAIGDPKYDNNPSLKIRPEDGLLKLRKELGLFANVRPTAVYASSFDNSPLKREVIEDVDFVIFRELTGGLYFGEKNLNEEGNVASDSCTYSKEEIERVAKLAFEMAGKRNNKLTLVDKANVLETSRLWRKVIQEMTKGYPEVTVNYLFVDNAAMQLMLNPRQFDVILTENLFGDILSDQASVITGSLGLSPSSSIGGTTAVFEPVHGSYPQAAGKDIANPFAMILSVAMMYDYFDLNEEATLIRKAINSALDENKVTEDLSKDKSYLTSEVMAYLVKFIQEREQAVING